MPVDGWSFGGGTPRLLCTAPPGGDDGDGGGGGEDGGGGPSGFIANCFLGYPWPQTQPASPAMPSITPGTGDFSLEVWARRKIGNSIDDSFATGILENRSGSDIPDTIAVILWEPGDVVSARFDALGGGAPGEISTGAQSPTRLGRMSHYAVNFDRNANMELFIDAESIATASISAQQDSVTGEVHALTSTHVDPYHDTDFNDWDNTAPLFPVIVGPFAIHNRLMTNGEIQNSYRNRKVQNDVALINFDWRRIEGQTGWDTDWNNMMLGHKFGLPVPAGAPLGAAGTVSVRDQSGNGNHWTIPTVADYTLYDAPDIGFPATLEDGLWPMPFGADPFFS